MPCHPLCWGSEEQPAIGPIPSLWGHGIHCWGSRGSMRGDKRWPLEGRLICSLVSHAHTCNCQRMMVTTRDSHHLLAAAPTWWCSGGGWQQCGPAVCCPCSTPMPWWGVLHCGLLATNCHNDTMTGLGHTQGQLLVATHYMAACPSQGLPAVLKECW